MAAASLGVVGPIESWLDQLRSIERRRADLIVRRIVESWIDGALEAELSVQPTEAALTPAGSREPQNAEGLSEVQL